MLGKYTQSKWLKSEDLQGEHVTQIQFVEEVEFKSSTGHTETKIAMTFIHYPKPLILNITNIRMLQDLFGHDAEPNDLIGKEVTIFTVPTQMPDGSSTMGIRLRAVPNLQPPPPLHEQPVKNAGLGATPSDRPPVDLNADPAEPDRMQEDIPF